MFTALLDANVLVPVSLADTVLRAAERDLYRPLWSVRILDEVRRALHKIHPTAPPSRFETRIAAMNMTFPDSTLTDFDGILPSIELPDPDDRHVVAAAYTGGADLIVTNNLKDFPQDELKRWRLEAVNPDCFLCDMFDLFPQAMLIIIQEQTADMQHPPTDVDELLASLERAGVPEFVHAVRQKL